MVGMSSACINPLLYGWLNENFRNEFLEIFNIFKSAFCPCFEGQGEDDVEMTNMNHKDDDDDLEEAPRPENANGVV